MKFVHKVKSAKPWKLLSPESLLCPWKVPPTLSSNNQMCSFIGTITWASVEKKDEGKRMSLSELCANIGLVSAGAAAPQRLLIVSFFGVSADLINTFELGKALIWIELILYPQCFSIVHSVHSSYMLSQISWR